MDAVEVLGLFFIGFGCAALGWVILDGIWR